MSESKRYYETGKAIADGFVRGWKATIPGVIDEWDETFTDDLYITAVESAANPVELRTSPDGRDIGYLIFLTSEDCDRLEECMRISGMKRSEVVSRALSHYYFTETLWRPLGGSDPNEDSM